MVIWERVRKLKLSYFLFSSVFHGIQIKSVSTWLSVLSLRSGISLHFSGRCWSAMFGAHKSGWNFFLSPPTLREWGCRGWKQKQKKEEDDMGGRRTMYTETYFIKSIASVIHELHVLECICGKDLCFVSHTHIFSQPPFLHHRPNSIVLFSDLCSSYFSLCFPHHLYHIINYLSPCQFSFSGSQWDTLHAFIADFFSPFFLFFFQRKSTLFTG